MRPRLASAIVRGSIAAAITATVGFASAPAAFGLQALDLTANASAGDSGERAVVYLGGPSGAHICRGELSHTAMRATLPSLRTSAAGGGKWTWSVAAGVTAGRWRVHVTCSLASGVISADTAFGASAGPRTQHRAQSLTRARVQGTAWTSFATSRGKGGGDNIDYYPPSQCTWLAQHLRPDLPFFPGPGGNAGNWIISAQHAGFATGVRARPHAVVVFAPQQAAGTYKGIARYAGQYGHVAFVKAVKGANMTITESNVIGPGRVDTRSLAWRGKGFHFIYSSTAPPPRVPGQATNATPFDVYRTCANGHCGLQEYQGPGQSKPSSGKDHVYPDGSKVYVVCQTPGDRVVGLDASSTNVWDRLADGGFVSDYYVTTPEKDDRFSIPLQQCGTSGALTVALSSPSAGATLTGTVMLSATSNAPAVQFAAYYSTTPGIAGSATWHTIATDSSPSGQTFTTMWNTVTGPNQGGPGQDTVLIAATAIDSDGTPSGAQDVRRIAVANPGADGNFAYHVQGTCSDSNCKLNLRAGPGYSNYPLLGTKNEGDEVDISCQASGEVVSGSGGTTNIWDRLTDGSWASDLYIDTPNPGNLSPPIPQCSSIPPPPSPQVQLTEPTASSVLTGRIQISATSNESDVTFDAYYSTTPGVAGTATWHPIGTVMSTNGTFVVSWDTSQVPNQGQAAQDTVQVRVTALDGAGDPTSVQDERRVDIENPSADGSYAYHVYGTCGDNSCELNLRSGPGYTNYQITGTEHEGDELNIVCQTQGEAVSASSGTSDVWDKLANGSWAADFYVDTPVFGAFSPPIPQC
jgi:surface antigen